MVMAAGPVLLLIPTVHKPIMPMQLLTLPLSPFSLLSGLGLRASLCNELGQVHKLDMLGLTNRERLRAGIRDLEAAFYGP